MDKPTRPPKLASPTTLRLRQEVVDAIDAAGHEQGRLRSELLTEAIDHWLLLNAHGLDAVRIVNALNRPDHELAEVENTTAGALELLQEARARLIALTLSTPPQIF
jgi:hypothetical protein